MSPAPSRKTYHNEPNFRTGFIFSLPTIMDYPKLPTLASDARGGNGEWSSVNW